MHEASDVVIVGGGVVGTACAYYLAKAGYSVRVVDKGEYGRGATYGNCGLIFSSHLLPLCSPGVLQKSLGGLFKRTSPLYIKPGTDLERLLWLLRFAGHCRAKHLVSAVRAREGLLRHSRLLYQHLLQEEPLSCEWEQRGVLLVCRDPGQMEHYRQTNRWLRRYGIAAVPHAGAELRKMEPALREDLCGGWYHALDSHLRPDRLVTGWRAVLEDMGVAVEEHCSVHDFAVEASRVSGVETDRGSFRGRYFVLTVGAWTAAFMRRLGLRVPIEPGKGYSVTMPRPALCPRIPCIFEERKVVATPWPSGLRLGGTMEFSGLHHRPNPARSRQLVEAARLYLAQPGDRPVLEEWTGLRPMACDDLPIIDRLPQHPNIVLAAGHGMSGISMAPGTGKLVAELIAGQRPHMDPRPFGLRRFRWLRQRQPSDARPVSGRARAQDTERMRL